jgi:hypothetical protein
MNLAAGNRLGLGIMVVLAALLLLAMSPWVGLAVGLVGLTLVALYYRKR